MSWKTPENSRLEPSSAANTTIRQVDQKHCALSTQPSPHLQNRKKIDSMCLKFTDAYER